MNPKDLLKTKVANDPENWRALAEAGARKAVAQSFAEPFPERAVCSLTDEMRRLTIHPTTVEESLNKTERSYLAWLRVQGDAWFGVQCFRLQIGHDCWFTPDFWALDAQGLRCIDTKSVRKGQSRPHVEDDAWVKLRVAARLYPFVHFLVAWREGEIWQHRVVKP